MLENKLELLAPAGKWDVLESVAAAGADAVYLGGKKFNMRIIRPGFNFTNEELKRAAEFLHERNKKIYVTVNNLYFDYELAELKEYLFFLNSIKVDALIVQDMAMVEMFREMNISIPLHASVQMGIANLASVKYLEEKGFERVVLSKNLSLREITRIHEGSRLGIEFFAHGELCVAHTGHCYMSQLLFGQSGNRGSCKKPCRWKYQLHRKESDDRFKNYLSNNDLCVYPYLAEMVRAGVTSFKIEGRMKNTDYLIPLITHYRRAMDRLIENPQDYQTDLAAMDELTESRVRDYTTGHFLSRPSLKSIGMTGEREPYFDTAPVKLHRLVEDDYALPDDIPVATAELTVKVANMDALQRLKGHGVDNVILALEVFRQNGSKWGSELLEEAVQAARANGQKVYLETPGVLTEDDWPVFEKYGKTRTQTADGLIVNDYGSLHYWRNLWPDQEYWAGPGLNITNSKAFRDIKRCGVKRLVMPYELDASQVNGLLEDRAELQLMVQGPICGMVTDLCLAGSFKNQDEKCAGFCTRGEYALLDEQGQKYNLKSDSNCRNYLYYPYELCLLMHLPALADMGIKCFTIEGQYYNPDILEEIVAIYADALDNIEHGVWRQHENYQRLLQLIPAGLTDRPFITRTQLK